jgi:hypothetical protein
MAAASAEDMQTAIEGATIGGAASGSLLAGLPQGLGAGILAKYPKLYTYTTTAAAGGIGSTGTINAPVFATIIPPQIMKMPIIGFFAKLTFGWIGPYKNLTYYPLQYFYEVNPAYFQLMWLKVWQWVSNTPVPPGPGGPL